MAGKKRHNPFTAKKERDKKKKLQAERSFPKKEFDEYWKKNSDEVSRAVYDAFLDVLANEKLFMMSRGPYGRSQKQEIFKGNVGKFCDYVPKKFNGAMLREMVPDLPRVIHGVILNCDNMPLVEFAMSNSEKFASKVIMNYLHETKRDREIVDYIAANLNEMVVYEHVSHNPRYIKAAERIAKVMEAKMLLYKNIQTSTPGDYTMLFPLAREMKRHFVLHIGPTNSGKTYEAVQELMAAESGIYL